MKRFLLYVTLLLQVVMIILIAIQFDLIDRYGQHVYLKTVIQEYYDPEYDSFEGPIFTEYEINFISNDVWKIDESLQYNDRVYVVLGLTEEGTYNVVDVSEDSIKANDDQIVLIGKYQYEDTRLNQHIVHYDIEIIDRKRLGVEFRPDQEAIVTLLVAPWGQKKMIDVKMIED